MTPRRRKVKPVVITLTQDGDDVVVEMQTETRRAQIYYTTDGSDPTPQSEPYIAPVRIPNARIP